MLRPAALILLCAVPAGWLAGRAWSRADASGSGKKAVEAASQAPGRPVKKEAPRRREMGKEEFIASIFGHLEATMAPGYNPMGDELADWTDEELIAALQESITDPALHGLPGKEGKEGNATLFLLQEWMKRDPAASAKWVDSLESTMLKGAARAVHRRLLACGSRGEGACLPAGKSGDFRKRHGRAADLESDGQCCGQGTRRRQ